MRLTLLIMFAFSILICGCEGVLYLASRNEKEEDEGVHTQLYVTATTLPYGVVGEEYGPHQLKAHGGSGQYTCGQRLLANLSLTGCTCSLTAQLMALPPKKEPVPSKSKFRTVFTQI